jgi:hypothetical protein
VVDEIEFKRKKKRIFSYYAGGEECLTYYDDLKKLRKYFNVREATEKVFPW